MSDWNSDYTERQYEDQLAELRQQLAASEAAREKTKQALADMTRDRDYAVKDRNMASERAREAERERDALAAALDNLTRYQAVVGNLGDGERFFLAYYGDPDIAGVTFNPKYDAWEAFEKFEKFLRDKVDKTKAAAILRAHDAEKDQEIAALASALEEFRKQLLNDEDILDGPNPGDPPRPNWAMQADMLLGRILTRMELEPFEILRQHDAALVEPLKDAVESWADCRQTAEGALSLIREALAAYRKEHA